MVAVLLLALACTSDASTGDDTATADGPSDGGVASEDTGTATDGGAEDGGVGDDTGGDGGSDGGGDTGTSACEWWVPTEAGTPPEEPLLGEVDLHGRTAAFINGGERNGEYDLRYDWNGDGWQELLTFGYSWPDNEDGASALRVRTGPVLPGTEVPYDTGWCAQWMTGDERYQNYQAVTDWNDDGFDDLLFTYYIDSEPKVGSNEPAGVHLLLGPNGTGTVERPISDSWDVSPWGGMGSFHVGDLTSDGWTDIVLNFTDEVEQEYVLFVADGTMDGPTAMADPAARLSGGILGSWSISVRGVSDLDGDGYTDLLTRTTAWYGPGAVQLFPGPLDGSYTLDDATLEIANDSADSAFGLRVEANQDFDGDGYTDLLVADPWDDSVYRGRVYLVPGPLTGSGMVKDLAIATVESELSNTAFAWDMVANQDMDGDGELDLVISAEDEDTDPEGGSSGRNNGAIYLFYGPMSGARTTDDADARMTHSGCMEGDASGCKTGALLKGMGDLNADGYDDVVTYIGLSTSGDEKHIIFGAPR